MNKKFAKILTVILMIFGLLIFTGCESNTPETVALKYLNALKAGDVETMQECLYPEQQNTGKLGKTLGKSLTNKLFGTDIDNDNYTALTGQILAMFYGKYTYEVTSSEVGEETGVVYFDTYKSGELYLTNQAISVRKYNGKWYIG